MDNLPSGCIILWFGAATNIPPGYVLCNGANNTPDLRNSFVIGAGSSYSPGNTGGSQTHTHTASTAVTVNYGGEHYHGVPVNWYANTASSGKGITIVDRNASQPPWNTTTDGDHDHTAQASTSIAYASNMPPYYALCYIMKT